MDYLVDRKLLTIRSLANDFLNEYFPNQLRSEAGPNRPEMDLHDAAHKFTNVPPSVRGEFQQEICDMAGTAVLIVQLGARGLINEPRVQGGVPQLERGISEVLSRLEKERKAANNEWENPSASPYGSFPVNDIRRLHLPSMDANEITELCNRGVAFYSQIVPQVQNAINNGEVGDGPGRYIIGNTDKIIIEGGYSESKALPCGPREQLVQMPAELTVDEGGARRNWVALLEKRLKEERFYILSYSDVEFERVGGKLPRPPIGMPQDYYLSELQQARESAKMEGPVAADRYVVKVRATMSRVGALRDYPQLRLIGNSPNIVLKEHDRRVAEWIRAGFGKPGSARMWNVHMDFDGTDLAAQTYSKNKGPRNEEIMEAIDEARKIRQVREIMVIAIADLYQFAQKVAVFCSTLM